MEKIVQAYRQNHGMKITSPSGTLDVIIRGYGGSHDRRWVALGVWQDNRPSRVILNRSGILFPENKKGEKYNPLPGVVFGVLDSTIENDRQEDIVLLEYTVPEGTRIEEGYYRQSLRQQSVRRRNWY